MPIPAGAAGRHGVVGGAAALGAIEGDRGEADEEAVPADSPDRRRAASWVAREAATCVPRFSTDEERLEAERLEEYVSATRATMRVFARYHHKKQSLVEMDKCFVWLNSWAMLSGFGSYCVVSDTVSARRFRVVRGLSDRRGCFDM